MTNVRAILDEHCMMEYPGNRAIAADLINAYFEEEIKKVAEGKDVFLAAGGEKEYYIVGQKWYDQNVYPFIDKLPTKSGKI